MLDGAEKQGSLCPPGPDLWPWARKCLRPSMSGFVIGMSRGPEELDRGLGHERPSSLSSRTMHQRSHQPTLMA